MRSGDAASTASCEGSFSASTGSFAAVFSHFAGTGPSWNAVPTMRSPRPSASSISVDVDLIVITRFGAAAPKSTVVPQLSMLSDDGDDDGCRTCAVAVGEQPARARAAIAATATSALRERVIERDGTDSPGGRHGCDHPRALLAGGRPAAPDPGPARRTTSGAGVRPPTLRVLAAPGGLHVGIALEAAPPK